MALYDDYIAAVGGSQSGEVAEELITGKPKEKPKKEQPGTVSTTPSVVTSVPTVGQYIQTVGQSQSPDVAQNIILPPSAPTPTQYFEAIGMSQSPDVAQTLIGTVKKPIVPQPIAPTQLDRSRMAYAGIMGSALETQARQEQLRQLEARMLDYQRKLTDPIYGQLVIDGLRKQAEQQLEDTLKKVQESSPLIASQIAKGKKAEEALPDYKTDDGGYDIARFLRERPEDEFILTQYFKPEDISAAKESNKIVPDPDEYQIRYFQDKGWSTELPGFDDPERTQKLEQFQNRLDESGREYAKQYNLSGIDIAKKTALLAADLLVPGVYVARKWNTLSGGEKAFNIAIDVLAVLPVIRAAGVGARGVSTAGRLARLTGAGTSVGREVVTQLKAPIDLVLHPISSVKGTAKQIREVVENIAHPKKLPEAVITTTNETVRLKVSEATSPEEAKQIRDIMMDLASKGEKPVLEINGIKYELSRSPLMSELKGGLAHATPMGEAFETGLKVAEKPLMTTTEQGLFVSHEPLPRFAKSSAFGKSGDKPAIIVTSPETATKAVPTGKIYAGTAEMELKYPIGVSIPEPKQKLFTRLTDGTRVEIWLEIPLGIRQIIKLKSLGLIEDIVSPFKPAITIDGTLDSTTIRNLSDILDESGNQSVARNLIRNEEMIGGVARDSTLTRVDRVARTTDDIRDFARIKVDYYKRESGLDRSTEGLRGSERIEPLSRTSERLTDSRIIETRIPEERLPEERVPDDRLPSERIPSQRVPDTRTPEERLPDDRVPDTRMDDSRLPDSRVPDSRLPDARLPRIERPVEEMKAPIIRRKSEKQDAKERKQEAFRGAITWKWGFGWYSIKSPYKTNSDIAFFKEPPPEAVIIQDAKSIYQTIQLLTGKPPSRELTIPIGIMTLKIKKPPRKQPGDALDVVSLTMNKQAKKGKPTGMVRII
jgi:hypothetical protein